MPNFSYKNISEILTTQDPIRGVRILQSDLNGRIIVPRFSSLNQPDDPFAPYTNIEFHAFLPNGAYVDTLYNINYNVVLKENPNGETIKYVVLDIHNDLRDARLIPGPYKVVYNFFRNVIGSSERENRLFISDISSDRREIKLSLTDPNDLVSRKELSDFVLEYMAGSKYMMPVVLNFGQNNIVHVINVTSDGDPNYFYVRLIDPLPSDVDTFFQCWLSSQIMKPYIDNVIVIRDDIDDMPSYISGPNFDVEYDYWTNSETNYKSWNELLQTNVQTSQEIVNRYLLNSGSYTKLNYDFTQFENFIFYSSAEERIENFYYKIQLIEHYNSELDTLNTYTGSLDLNKTKIKNLREKVVSGFDDFEKWMYYETTASGIYTYQASSSIIPYPKYEVTSSDYHIATKEGKYKLYAVTSSQVDDWYTNLLDIATDYDMLNENALHKAIPEYLREDTDNDQFTTFVNMIGQHFDILYFYTDHILKKNLREEHPKDGLSQDLIFEATKNMGWQLSHGTQTKDLWEYAFGLSGSGEPIWSGKTTISKYHTKTEEERTKEVWRRIFNNLSYIYKTKGTARGIKALLAAYGIPQTILSIREFGGPDNADLGVIPRYEWEKHTYYLNYSGSFSTPTPTQYVRVPWERVNNADGNWQYADTVTFRWKMEPNDYYTHAVDPVQTILQKNSGSKVDWFVAINKTGSNDEYGDLTFYLGSGSAYKSASITNQYLYDDVPLNIMIRRNTSTDVSSSNQSYDFILKTSKYGKLAIEQSASIYITGSTESAYNKSWVSDGNLFIGSGSNFKTNKMLSGSIFELRYWSKVLDTDSFDNHVLSARSYNGNTPTSSFYDLQGQWKFWQKFDASITSSIVSSHPDQTKLSFYSSSKNAYLYGFGEDSFEPIVESYNMEVATVAQDTPFSEKVRIDSASLNGGSLQKDWASDISAFDRYSVDSNKLMVAFSPQNTINEDIYESIGNVWIDDYFGEYSNVNREEYPRLKWFAREYWKKYKNRNDFTAYIRLISLFDFSVFDQIRQSLPARVNEILGLVIEPNILERSKVKVAKNFYAEPPEKFVKDTTELSKEAGLAISISTSNTTTVYVGFDEDILSEISEVEGEHDVITELNAETDDLNDDVDVLTTVSLENFSENGTIKYSPKMTSSSYQDLKGGLKKEYTFDGGLNADHFAVISNRPNVIGTNNDIADYSILNIGFTNTFSRNNVIKGTQSGSISSPQWYFVPNEYSKRIAVFDTIYKNRNDDHYNAFKFYYTSSLNADGSNYSSYQYVTSSYMNPETFPVGQRNYRFNGCKLPDNDIINKFSYPNYSENYSYEDVNNDPSSIILLILPWEFLPSWLRTARQKQRDRR